MSALALFLLVMALLATDGTIRESGIWQLSAKDVAQLVRHYEGTAENLRLVRVNRSAQYQLNFYVGAELRQWDGRPKDGELLLGRSISCSGLGLGNECTNLWGYVDRSDDWVLLKISENTTSSGRP